MVANHVVDRPPPRRPGRVLCCNVDARSLALDRHNAEAKRNAFEWERWVKTGQVDPGPFGNWFFSDLMVLIFEALIEGHAPGAAIAWSASMANPAKPYTGTVWSQEI